MKKFLGTIILVMILMSFLVSCSLIQVEGEDCRAFRGVANGGYAVEIQGIPDIEKLDIDRTVRSFSRRIETPKVFDYPGDYRFIRIFYELNTSRWFTPVRYSLDDKPSPHPKTIRNFWHTSVMP